MKKLIDVFVTGKTPTTLKKLKKSEKKKKRKLRIR